MRAPSPPTSFWPSLRVPLLLILLWWLLLFLLLMWTQRREDAYMEELARLQLETLYSSIADMRDWNAENGGVFVPENPGSPANPWIPEEKRALLGADGQRLIKINPAYMVRLISENFRSTMARFRITGLHPKRPGNQADAWETAALERVDARHGEYFELVPSTPPQFRSLAALHAKKSCLECHEHATEGELLGGISLTLDAAPLRQAAETRKTAAAQAFGLIGLVGTLGIGGATWQLNRKKEKAEAANRLKSAFLANMTHDMRTPLTGMLGMAELLARETAEPRRRYLLENLRDAASSLLDVVDGVMRYSLLEADRRPVRNEPFQPREEVDACLAAIRPACDAKELALDYRVDPDVPPVLIGDAFRLRQALGNVLGNAVKFTDHGAISLRVACERESAASRMLRFEVRDTGPGVPPADRERIFEAFAQGTRRAPAARGVGLGLATARNIARACGGDLALEQCSGQGSLFVLTLRFAAASSGSEKNAARAQEEAAPTRSTVPPATLHSAAVPASPEAAPARRGEVLVVEDSPVSALFLHEALSGAGYSAHMANNGTDALFLLESRRFDAVLLDLGLPDMDGLDIARRIRSGQTGAQAHIPVLLLSALPLSGEANGKPDAAESCRFLLKPVRMAQLLETLDDMLAVSPGEMPAQGETASSPATEEGDPLFVRRDALDAADGNVSLLQRMIGAFLEEVPALAAALEQGTSAADLRGTAHSLKNSAALLGLPRLRSACAALEAAISPENGLSTEGASETDVDPLRAKAERELKRALTVLRREQEKEDGPAAGD